jgi:hypothetical protein
MLREIGARNRNDMMFVLTVYTQCLDPCDTPVATPSSSKRKRPSVFAASPHPLRADRVLARVAWQVWPVDRLVTPRLEHERSHCHARRWRTTDSKLDPAYLVASTGCQRGYCALALGAPKEG